MASWGKYGMSEKQLPSDYYYSIFLMFFLVFNVYLFNVYIYSCHIGHIGLLCRLL